MQGCCEYCGARAVNADHVVPRSVYKRLSRGVLARREMTIRKQPPSWLKDTVGACFDCNMAKASRLLIPRSWAHRLEELNSLGIGTFRVWAGDAALLRVMCK